MQISCSRKRSFAADRADVLKGGRADLRQRGMAVAEFDEVAVRGDPGKSEFMSATVGIAPRNSNGGQ